MSQPDKVAAVKRTFPVKKLLSALIVAGVVLGGAAYGWHLWQEHKNERVAYTFASVAKGTLEETVSANGMLQPRDVLIVGSEMSGKVVAVLADYNQTVREGDVLLRLDDRLARMQLEKAETAVKLAKVAIKQAEATRDMANSAYKHLDKMPSEVRSKTEVEIARDKLRAAEVGIEAAQVKVQEAEDARRQAELGL